MAITLPHRFEPRDYQVPILAAMDSGYKRAIGIWHRRAGKDKTFLNHMIKCMAKRVGQYYYYFPTMTQGRKSLWEGIDRDGFRYIEHFPKELITKKNDQEMKIEFRNGSIFHLLGTDKLEVVGPNPVGVAFSEYSLQHPKGWEYVRPILAENQGWAMFNYTPRGKNHAFRLYRMAQDNKDWYCELLTVDKTHAITQEAIDAERRAGMSEALIQQEFYCSFDKGQEGAFYSEVLNALYSQGRVTNDIAYHAGLPVHTICDPGYHWPWAYFQVRGNEPVIIRAYEELGLGVEGHAELLEKNKKKYGYRYGRHLAPVDTEKNNAYKAVAGKSLCEHAKENGIEFTILKPELSILDGIERTRHFLFGCWFVKDDCELLLDALQAYCAAKVERVSTELQPVYDNRPAKNWAVHLADTMRYLSKAFKENKITSPDGAITKEQVKEWEQKYRRTG